VFAEPDQGVPLARASASVPSIKFTFVGGGEQIGEITRLLLPRPFFSFVSNRSFYLERERQKLCQCAQFIYIHYSLSFFVPSYPRSLSIEGLNADGTIFSLEYPTGDSGKVAEIGTIF